MRPDLEEMQQQLRAFFGCHHEGLVCVYLYGGRARGEARQQSDVDRQMVGFRNIVVHGDQSVDLHIMRHIVEHRLDDLLAFMTPITTRLHT